MESHTHHALKQLALHRLFADGCAAAAAEVRCPIARFRVDVAGYLDPIPKKRTGRWETPGQSGPEAGAAQDPAVERAPAARTVIVECKASRADFMVDSRNAERLLRERDRLRLIRNAIEQQFVKVVEPHLRQEGSSLFAELEDWNFSQSRLQSYHKLLLEIRSIDERLHGQTKFWTVRHYRLADYLYVAAPAGLIRARELPEGWGLLEPETGAGMSGELRIVVACPPQPGNPAHRSRMLRNIAAAASRRLFLRASPKPHHDLS